VLQQTLRCYHKATHAARALTTRLLQQRTWQVCSTTTCRAGAAFQDTWQQCLHGMLEMAGGSFGLSLGSPNLYH
jgi:hypothetical protein